MRIPFISKPKPFVPHLRFEGVIGGGGRFSRGLSLAAVEPSLARAFKSGKAAAVAISINSPGGSPVQSRLIHDRIRALADEKKLPVLVFCEDLAASGGYMLALAGDEIYADVSSIVGSIGVVGASFGAHEAIAKLGVERRVYTAGKNKVRLDPFRPETEDDRAFVTRIQSAIHAGFIELVKARREGKLDAQTELFEGDVWTGQEAVGLGVIDGIGHARAVLRERFGDQVRIKDVPTAKTPLVKRLMGGGADAVVAALEERLAYARFGL